MQPQAYDPQSVVAEPLNQPAVSIPVQSNASAAAQPSPITTSAQIPDQALDADLIEKTWVDAAKRIMEENVTDPFTQNSAMTLLRKDYMKKRYGENIKPES